MTTQIKEKHRVFVEAYLSNGGVGVEAARAAGYTGNDNTLTSRASKILARSDVQAALDERVVDDPKVMTRIERQQLWSKIARADGIKVPWKERIAALRDLARSQGDFVNRHEVLVTGAVVVIPDNRRGDGPVTKAAPAKP